MIAQIYWGNHKTDKMKIQKFAWYTIIIMIIKKLFRKTPVVGITSLALDHMNLLGNTIEEIAWNKAGIMKEGSKVFTVPQSETAMKVLKARSIERKVINASS